MASEALQQSVETPTTAKLYLFEIEVAQRVGVSEKAWRRLAPVLERDGLPRKDALIGKRYWPAVRAWLDRRHMTHGTIPTSAQDGEENWG
ncbi:hypothetical protein [Kaistia sp. MMO-174]|uniref:hypothetical protein n=1 Tax=Kaistia sp. MMO-174 TaxID=3081256 RepID=UPI00301A400A